MTNPMGSVHGGIAATLLDTVMGCAVHTVLDDGESYTTTDLHVHYVRGVNPGKTIVATGTVVHRGRRLATAEGRVARRARPPRRPRHHQLHGLPHPPLERFGAVTV